MQYRVEKLERFWCKNNCNSTIVFFGRGAGAKATAGYIKAGGVKLVFVVQDILVARKRGRVCAAFTECIVGAALHVCRE